MIKCARCGLINPDGATLCECGFDLVHGDAAAVRGVLKRKGWLHVSIGAVLIVVGVLGGLAVFSFEPILFFQIGGHRIDLVFVLAGAVLVARGFRIIDRPWTEKPK